MNTPKSSIFKWLTIIYVVSAVIVLLVLFSELFQTSGPKKMPQIVWLLGFVVLLTAIITLIAKTFALHSAVEENGARLDKIAEAFEKIHDTLKQVNQNTRISEKAKSIAFRDADGQALREAVFDKLQKQEFDAVSAIIDEIAGVEGYSSIAEQLRSQADRYRDATDAERVSQVITHIERLLDNYEWQKASAQIERLIKDYPNSEQAKAMRYRLADKKEERKKILLRSWDDAVKRGATDRSLEVLRELDQYLNPNEGLALQEAARSVFRNKLHSLGVQFSLAVSGNQWAQAIQTGGEIIRDFPNSRMAEEIREKMPVLKQKAQQ